MPKKYGIFIVGLANGEPSKCAGEWLRYYDATKRGGRGEIRSTPDPARALSFDGVAAAADVWMTAYGTRPDGKPNRPLTAYTVEMRELP